jgi:hypothetical protein
MLRHRVIEMRIAALRRARHPPIPDRAGEGPR